MHEIVTRPKSLKIYLVYIHDFNINKLLVDQICISMSIFSYVASTMMMVSSSLRTTTQSECYNWNCYCMKVKFVLNIFIFLLLLGSATSVLPTSLQHILPIIICSTYFAHHNMLHSIFLSHTLHIIHFQQLAESLIAKSTLSIHRSLILIICKNLYKSHFPSHIQSLILLFSMNLRTHVYLKDSS